MEIVPSKGQKSNLLSALFIAAAVIIYFSPVIFSTNNYFTGDIYTQFFPWKDFLKKAVQDSVAPFWNPFVYSGVPFLADIQKGAFYPPGIIFLYLDFSSAFKAYVVLHFLIMGLSCFFLLRQLGFSRVPSIAGTFLFLFNSFTVSKVNFLSALASFSWIPLIILSLYRFLETKEMYYWPLFIIFVSLSVLAGHPPTVFYTGLLVFFFWIYYTSLTHKKIDLKMVLNIIFFVSVSIAAVIMLSMPQAGLFLELLGLSSRGAPFEYNIASITSMPYRNLWCFLMPGGLNGFHINYLMDWAGFSMGITNYFSITAVFLVCLSFFYPKNRLYMLSFFTAALGILLALGKNTPVHSLFFTFFPFFSQLRHPGFAMTLTVLPFAVITAFTVEHIRSLTQAHVPVINRFSFTSVFSRRVFRFLFYCITAMAVMLLLVVMDKDQVMKNYGMNSVVFANFITGYLVFLLIFGFNFLIFYLREKQQVSYNFYVGVVLFALFFELMYFISGINPAINDKIYSPAALNLPAVQLIKSSNYKFLHTEASNSNTLTRGRNLLDAQINFLSAVPSNTGLLYGLNDAGGYNPVEPKNYTDYLHTVIRGDSVIDREKLNILNIKYLITLNDADIPDCEKIYDGAVKVYKNSRALPLFFTTKTPDRLELVVGQYSWSRKKEYDYTMYNIEANVEKDGYFVFSNNVYPGWSVYVDNKAGVLEKCFGIFMGVKISGGPHTIIFRYSPVNLRLYMIMFLVIAGTLLFLGIGYLFLSFRKKDL